MHLVIYGVSDDLVEVEGDKRIEWDAERGLLLFNDGTELAIEYNGGGVWTFDVRKLGDEAQIKIHPAVPETSTRREEGEPFAGLPTYSQIAVYDSPRDVEVAFTKDGWR